MMTKHELIETAYELTSGNVADLNRVEKVNKRRKYRFAKVFYKTGKGEDAVMHSRSNGRTPLQWVRWAFAEAGYFEEHKGDVGSGLVKPSSAILSA